MDMNLREQFLEVMENFETRVSVPKWEFGYWGETVDNWYSEGLFKKQYPNIPKNISTPTASLYNPAWSSVKTGKLPAGIAVIGGGLYWPTQSFCIDNDIKDTLGMDIGQILVNVNLLFHPMFELEIQEEDDDYLIYRDIDGILRKFVKQTGVIPTGVEWVINDWKSWEKVKEERLNTNDIHGRFPINWSTLVQKYKNRNYPLVLGGYPHGYFMTLAHLMGYESLFYTYFDNPKFIHDIQDTLTELWIAVYSEIFSEISVDLFVFCEDISAGTGSMVSPAMIKEYMIPYYKRLIGFLKENGVKVIFIDTDGDCYDLIPLFLEAGVTGMYPIEVSCGMDLVKVRKNFPELQLMGGIPKSEIQYGRERIDKILEPVAETLKYGGYIPFCDHLIPPEIHWDNFKYYRETLNRLIDRQRRNNGT
jgi:hypothetical protein